MKFEKVNWDKIESDVPSWQYSMPVEGGPAVLFEYCRVRSMTYCPAGAFIGVFVYGPPIHTRIPYEFILKAAEFTKKEILFRSFDDLRRNLHGIGNDYCRSCGRYSREHICQHCGYPSLNHEPETCQDCKDEFGHPDNCIGCPEPH